MGYDNEVAYRRLMEGAGSVPEVQVLVDGIRDATSAQKNFFLSSTVSSMAHGRRRFTAPLPPLSLLPGRLP